MNFCFITAAKNVISVASLQTTTESPQKYYFKPHLQQIQQKFEDIRQYGKAAVEEWLNGLDGNRKMEAQDIARWEQWEAKGGLRKVNARPNTRSNPSTRQSSNSTAHSSKPERPTIHSLSGPSHGIAMRVASPQPLSGWPANNLQLAFSTDQSVDSTTPSSSTAVTQPNGLPQRPPIQIPNSRGERNIKDVNDAKAARKAEIERRSMALEPPITPNLLVHMDSFQAALQITTPLTDSAWEMLKPRLVAQRSLAEEREKEQLEHSRMLLARIEDPTQNQGKDVRETSDREWEAIQGPVRETLAKLADEHIEKQWSGGHGLSKEYAPNFAADVLIYCRWKYYEEAAKRESTSAPRLPSKLVLENMKWLFDNKIRPHAEGSQRELFLCNGCDGNTKFYGFEAVIQHYAAKHTSTLSLGSVIVHWRAEWPEEPPFHPNPSVARSGLYHPHKALVSGAQTLPSVQAPPQTTPIAYGPTFSTATLMGYSTSYVPTSYPDQSNEYVGSPAFAPRTPFQGLAGYPPQPGPQAQTGPYAASPHPGFGFQPPPPAPPGVASGFPYSHGNASPAAYQPGYLQNGNTTPLHSTSLDLYQRQMTDMAKIAREVWFAIAGVKDMPQSVRIYVVIQHVVSRFEKLYTNEPSISMFIDGLDHNAHMRPVRSLNGLACKACVTSSKGQTLGHNAETQHPLGDRRLFTLPLLLNHFKSMHVERGRPSVDLQTGMEASRLDWKRDMIELPDTPIIADLVGADGMDNHKLQLLAPIFPEILPTTLPAPDSSQILGLLSSYGASKFNTQQEHKPQGASHEGHGSYSEVSSRHDPAPSRRSYSSLGFPSHSTPCTPEPAAEHEYDPNRPADFGKIFESHLLKHPQPDHPKASDLNEQHQNPAEVHKQESDYSPSSVGQTGRQGAYSDQLLRHHDRAGRRAPNNNGVSASGSEAHSEQSQRYPPRGKEDDEVDRFLSAVGPPAPQSMDEAERGYSQARQGTASRGSPRPRPASTHRSQADIVTLTEASRTGRRSVDSDNFQPPGQDRRATPRDDHVHTPHRSTYRPASRPRIIYISDRNQGSRNPPSPYEAERSGQIISLGNGSDREHRASYPRSESQHHSSSPQAPHREYYEPEATTTTVYHHSSPSRTVYIDGGQYILSGQRNPPGIVHEREWQPPQGHEEYVTRPVQYMTVRREDYDTHRYFVAGPVESADAGHRPQYVYQRNVAFYPDEHREQGAPRQAPPEFVEYRGHR